MRRVVIEKPGGYDRLEVEQVEDLVAGPGQVRVAVDAGRPLLAENADDPGRMEFSNSLAERAKASWSTSMPSSKNQ